MTVLELMERAGIQNETLVIAYLIDAIHFILQSTIGLLTIIYLTLKIKKLKE